MSEISLETKTLAPVRILEILEMYSDEDHLLTHDEILRHLDHEYNILLERKSIGRHLQNLTIAGFDIRTTRRGSYLAGRNFDNAELRVLIDNVLFSNYINENHAQQLIKKLRNMGDIAFRNQTHYVHEVVRRNRTKSPVIFYNAEIIGEAIEKKKRISFVNNRIIEKTLEPEPWRDEAEIVDPFYLVAKNGWYYLIGLADRDGPEIINFRLDKITNLRILGEARKDMPESIKRNFNLDAYLAARPYMYQGEQERVKFRIIKPLLDDILDEFGKDVSILEESAHHYIVSFVAGRYDAEHWALKNGHYAEILEPKHIRARVVKFVKEMQEKYPI